MMKRLSLALFVLISSLPLSVNSQTLPEQIVFQGRWDRRQPERAITVNSGSYVKARFQGTGITAFFDTALNQDPFPTIAWKIDQGPWQEANITGSVVLAEKLSPGTHDLFLMARGLNEHQSRWSPPLVASITLTGLQPTSGQFLPVPSENGPKLEFLGDSITEGVLVHGEKPRDTTPWPWLTDGRLSYAGQTAADLRAQWRQVGFGAQGITHGGSGGAVSAPDAFNFFYKDCPRDDWQPDAVIINQGTNDRGAQATVFKPAYETYLALIRAAYPKAKIIALVPFCGAHADSIKSVIEEKKKAGDHLLYVIDASSWLKAGDYTDGLHPNIEGSTKAAKHLVTALRPILLK